MRITALLQFVFAAFAMVLAGSATPIYVTSGILNNVGEYDAATGAVINANLIRLGSVPSGLALLGNTLFVASGGIVGEYDATTGAAINANFITGYKLALSGNILFVTNDNSTGTVGEYNNHRHRDQPQSDHGAERSRRTRRFRE